jgi:hypothetical protein
MSQEMKLRYTYSLCRGLSGPRALSVGDCVDKNTYVAAKNQLDILLTGSLRVSIDKTWTMILQTSNDRASNLPYQYFGNRPYSNDEKSKQNLGKSVPNTY